MLIAGNWKLHGSLKQTRELIQGIMQTLSSDLNVEVVVAPPFPYLSTAYELIRSSSFYLCGQDVHWEDQGACTGEVSAPMLKDVGCQFCIVGHSERRADFGDNHEAVSHKLAALLRHQMTPILCIGENLEQRTNGELYQVLTEQLDGAFNKLVSKEVPPFCIAYEPVWAIGTGKTASPEDAQQVHEFIRKYLTERFGQRTSAAFRLLYGGSVKPSNAALLLAQSEIDGALVGGASLKSEDFSSIVFEAEKLCSPSSP